MFITSLIDGIARNRRRRRTTIDLYGLGEHTLRDLGLTPSGLRTPNRPSAERLPS
jgi:uncharacterized protein YjiS (DUF1127 family)